MKEAPPPIGIAGVNIVAGDIDLTCEEFARISGVPLKTVLEKFGFTKLVRWGEEGPYLGVFRAASQALGGLDPRKLDAIIAFEHPHHNEHDVYGWGATLKEQLGAENATLLDVSTACASSTMSVHLARDLMIAEGLDHVLLFGIVKVADIIDITKQDMMWMANISDGAGCILLSRDPKLDNVVLETELYSDPSFADDVVLTPEDRERFGIVTHKERYRLVIPRRFDTPDKDDFKRRMDPVSVPNYVRVVNESLRRSGFTPEQLDLLGMNTIKPSVWRSVLDAFKLDPAKQIYLDEVGHMGYLDQFHYIERIRRKHLLRDGGVLVLATPGVGFHWTATTIAFKGPRLGGHFA